MQEVREQAAGERGVYTKTHVSSGQEVYSIPESLWLTPGRLRAHTAGAAALKWAKDKRPSWAKEQHDLEVLLITVLLLLEKVKPSSVWATYFVSLPWETTVLPLRWSPEELQDQLRGTPPQVEIETRQKELRETYSSLRKYCGGAAAAQFTKACPSPWLPRFLGLVHECLMK